MRKDESRLMPEDNQTAYAVLDPVCGMKIIPEKAAGHLEHNGKTPSRSLKFHCISDCAVWPTQQR
jgi:hypothetical protein